jgi:uncharacterized glyoxalase superfamily protein PhnB
MKQLTTVLAVESIEACLRFWTEGLGREGEVRVDHGDRLGFVILSGPGIELMLQSYASLGDDLPQIASELTAPTLLYAKVDDLEATFRRLGEVTEVVPLRKTFYGATERGIRTPGGHVLLLAQQGG